MDLERRVSGDNRARYEKNELLKQTVLEIVKPIYGLGRGLGKGLAIATFYYLGGIFAINSTYESKEWDDFSGMFVLGGTASLLLAGFGSVFDKDFLGKYNDEFVGIGLPIILGTNFVSYCYERHKKARKKVYGK